MTSGPDLSDLVPTASRRERLGDAVGVGYNDGAGLGVSGVPTAHEALARASSVRVMR